MKRLFVPLLALLACREPTSDSASSRPSTAAPSEAVLPPTRSEPAGAAEKAPLPSSAVPSSGWRWDHKRKEVEEGAPSVLHGRKERRIVLERGASPEQLSLRNEDAIGQVRWRVALPPRPLATGALTAHKDWIVVVHHSVNASGATLRVFDANLGAEVFAVALQGLGGVIHSRYHNQVQTQIVGDRLLIYGNETQGKYIESFEIGTWKRLSNTRVDERLATLPWHWSGGKRTSLPAGPRPLETADAVYRYVAPDPTKPAQLRKTDRAGSLLWQAQVPARVGCTAASMLEYATRLYLVHYCSSASGADLAIFDAGRGGVLAQRPVEGLGAISHSEYWNDVELNVLREKVVIFGKEAAGRYIEVIEPTSGALIALQRFRDW